MNYAPAKGWEYSVFLLTLLVHWGWGGGGGVWVPFWTGGHQHYDGIRGQCPWVFRQPGILFCTFPWAWGLMTKTDLLQAHCIGFLELPKITAKQVAENNRTVFSHSSRARSLKKRGWQGCVLSEASREASALTLLDSDSSTAWGDITLISSWHASSVSVSKCPLFIKTLIILG